MKISLVVPFLNEEGTLFEVLEGLLTQTRKPDEVIFVDAGSKDRSVEILRGWGKDHPEFNLRIVSCPGALPGAGRNCGVRAATHDWIAFLDAGIRPDPNWLERLAGALTPGVPGVWGSCRTQVKGLVPTLVAGYSLGVARVIPHVLPASLFARGVFDEIGFFREDLRAGEDVIWRNAFLSKYGLPDLPADAHVTYAHFPRSIWSVYLKWFHYSRHISLAGINRLQQRVYLLCFLMLFIVLAFKFLIPAAILCTGYILTRGLIDPIRRSKRPLWAGVNPWCYLLGPFFVLGLDIAKILGFINGFVANQLKKIKIWPSAWVISCIVFIYTLFLAFVVQTMVFPNIPSLANELGVLIGDNQFFHKLALENSRELKEFGWSAWSVFHVDNAAGINVGILAILYWWFGVHPWLILPLNAILHTIAFSLLYHFLASAFANRKHATIAALPFVVMPTTLLWITQFLKDTYAIPAWFALFLCILWGERKSLKLQAALLCAGFGLLIVIRPLYLYLIVLIGGLNLLMWGTRFLRKTCSLRSVLQAAMVVSLAVVALGIFRAWNPIIRNGESNQWVGADDYKWRKSWLPEAIDSRFEMLATIRASVIHFEAKGTTSTVDGNFVPESVWEFLGYTPRAVEIGLFFPTPAQLWGIFNIKSLTVVFEILFYYSLIPFGVIWLVRKRDRHLVGVVTLILFTEIFLAFITPNMGTYHRIRYPFFALLIGLGLVAFFEWAERGRIEHA